MTATGTQRLRRVLPALLALFLATAPLRAEAPPSFLWKVTGAQGTLHLAGSIHMLTTDFYPLSDALEAAFAASTVVVEEVDLGEMLTPNAQMALLTRGMLPAGQTVESVLSPATYALVASRVAELGLPFEPVKRFKPWALALMLTGIEWQRAGFDPELGLDRHFYVRALGMRKPIVGLETPAFQLALFDGLTGEQQDALVRQSLASADAERRQIATLTEAWRSGDAPTVERIVLQDLTSDPVIYARIVSDRNRAWLPRLESLLGGGASALVVVGAAHLVGPDGLLALLKAKGYAVEQE